jgi:hypothetical protein
MLRYKLRTLLILTTLACLYFAWVSYVRQSARFHRRQAAESVSRISSVEPYSRDDIESGVIQLAAGMAPTKTTHFKIGNGPNRITVVENGPRVSRIVNEEIVNEWHQAIYHARRARAYDRAAVQPWALLRD